MHFQRESLQETSGVVADQLEMLLYVLGLCSEVLLWLEKPPGQCTYTSTVGCCAEHKQRDDSSCEGETRLRPARLWK